MVRNAIVEVPYYHYSPHAVILGLRRAPECRPGDEASLLHTYAERCPGWQTLAWCQLEAGGFLHRGCQLTPRFTIQGSVALDIPHDVWNPELPDASLHSD